MTRAGKRLHNAAQEALTIAERMGPVTCPKCSATANLLRVVTENAGVNGRGLQLRRFIGYDCQKCGQRFRFEPEIRECEWCGYKVTNPCKTAEHRKQCDFS